MGGDETLGGVRREAFVIFLEGGGCRSNYKGSFRDCDILESQQKPYESNDLWSKDVASKWLDKVRKGPEGAHEEHLGKTPEALVPTLFHQQILKACNLQAILSEALMFLDPDIAWKGSRSTPGLKVESQRRLTMVMRGLLSLFKGFVSDCPDNQQSMFSQLDQLHLLATPKEVATSMGLGVMQGSRADERLANLNGVIEERHYKCYTDPDIEAAAAASAPATGLKRKMKVMSGYDGPKLTRQLSGTFGLSQGTGFPLKSRARWPTSIQEMAQDSILALLRGNERLCLLVAEKFSPGKSRSMGDALIHLAGHEVNREAALEVNALEQSKAAFKRGIGFFRRGLQGNMSLQLGVELGYGFTPDTVPFLDIFFVLCSPVRGRFLAEYQAATAAIILDPQFTGLRQWASDCIQRASSRAAKGFHTAHRSQDARASGELGGSDSDEEGDSHDLSKVENPYRMVRLLTVVMENNRETSVLLSQALGISFDALCECLVAHLHSATRRSQRSSGARLVPPSDVEEHLGNDIIELLSPPQLVLLAARNTGELLAKQQDASRAPAATTSVRARRVSAFSRKRSSLGDEDGSTEVDGESYLGGVDLSEHHESMAESGGAWDLLALMVAMVDELPVSETQARSPKLWGFMREVVVPAVETLAGRQRFSAADRFIAEQLVSVVDRLMAKFHRINIVEELIEDQAEGESHSENTLNDLRDDFYAISRDPSLARDLSPHAIEAIGRIHLVFQGRGDDVAPTRFPRHQPIKAKGVAPRRRASLNGAETPRTPGTAAGAPSNAVAAAARGSAPKVKEPVAVQMEAFKAGVMRNENIERTIARRQFHFVSVLEEGAPRRSGKGFEGAVEITWDMIVKRFVAFVRGLRFEKNESGNGAGVGAHSGIDTCILIFTVLRKHLVKARTYPLDAHGRVVRDAKGRVTFQDAERIVTLKTVRATDLPWEEARDYAAKLSALNNHDVMELMAQVLIENRAESASAGGDAPSLADEAFDVIVELFRGSNHHVRGKFFRFLVEDDVEGQFLVVIAGRLSGAVAAVHRARKATDEARKYVSEVPTGSASFSEGDESDARRDKALIRTQVSAVVKAVRS